MILTPAQWILFILALEVVSAPILIFCMTAVILTWWNKKKEFEIEREKRMLEIASGSIESLLGGMKEGLLIKKKEAENNECESSTDH